MLRPLVLAVALSSAFSQMVLAQAEPRVVDRGAHSISIGVGSSSSLGYWLRIAERTDLGLEVGVRIADDDDTYLRSLSFRPGIKRYLSSSESDFAPYVSFGAIAVWSRLDSGGAIDLDARDLGGFVGVGLDWFPVDRVSLGGHIGLEGRLTRRDQLGSSPLPDENVSGYDVATYSSGLRCQFFF